MRSPTFLQLSLDDHLIAETANGYDGSPPATSDEIRSADVPRERELGPCTFRGCSRPAEVALRFEPRPESGIVPPAPAAAYCEECAYKVGRLFVTRYVDAAELVEDETDAEAESQSRSCIALRVDGSPCRRTAVAGLDVCPTHGGRRASRRLNDRPTEGGRV